MRGPCSRTTALPQAGALARAAPSLLVAAALLPRRCHAPPAPPSPPASPLWKSTRSVMGLCARKGCPPIATQSRRHSRRQRQQLAPPPTSPARSHQRMLLVRAEEVRTMRAGATLRRSATSLVFWHCFARNISGRPDTENFRNFLFPTKRLSAQPCHAPARAHTPVLRAQGSAVLVKYPLPGPAARCCALLRVAARDYEEPARARRACSTDTGGWLAVQ
jgi:hypothetical protein